MSHPTRLESYCGTCCAALWFVALLLLALTVSLYPAWWSPKLQEQIYRISDGVLVVQEQTNAPSKVNGDLPVGLASRDGTAFARPATNNSQHLSNSADEDRTGEVTPPPPTSQPALGTASEAKHLPVDFPLVRFGKNKHIPPEALQAGLSRVPGDLSPLYHIKRRLLAGGNITVMVFGGSFTCGVGCGRDKRCKVELAWGTRLVERIRKAFPKAHIELDSQAKGSCTTRCTSVLWLDVFEEIKAQRKKAPDIVIFDHFLNDRKDGGVLMGNLKGNDEQQAIVDRLARRTAVVQEAMIRNVYAVSPKAQVLVLVSFFLLHERGYDWSSLQAAYARVCEHYHIPMPSYLDTIEAYVKRGKPRIDLWRPYGSHPGIYVHSYIADLLVYVFNSVRAKPPARKAGLDVQPLHSGAELAQYSPCHVISKYNSFDKNAGNLDWSTVNNSWRLYEDRPGKPGWITDGKRQGGITFQVVFGPSPRLLIEFLKSYEGFGDVSVDAGFRLMKNGVLHGRWTRKASQYSSTRFFADELKADFGVTPFSRANININLVGWHTRNFHRYNKFKLIALYTC